MISCLFWLLALAVLTTPAGFFVCRCVCKSTVTIQLQGCNGLGLDGETITIKQGATTIASGTTAGGGFVSFELEAGAYTAHVSAPTGFAPMAATGFEVGEECDPVGLTLGLAVDSDNHVCCPTRARPIPLALAYTDANGTIASTYHDGGSSKSWTVCYTIPKSGILTRDYLGNCDGGTTSADIAVQATLECTASGMRSTLLFFVVSCHTGPSIGGFDYCSYDPDSVCADVDGVPTATGDIPVLVNATSVTNALPTSFTGTWPTNSGAVCHNGNVLTPVNGSFVWAP